MKRLVRTLFLAGVLMAALCATAWAAEATVAGIYNVTSNSGVMITPDTNLDSSITSVGGTAINNFYPGAEKVTVTVSNAASGTQYLVLALNDNSATPTEKNIVYIDQDGATGDTVSFTVYPSQLVSGTTYHIYTSSTDATLAEVGTFEYYAPYKLGCVDNDATITATDALWTLQAVVSIRALTETQRLAADVDGDKNITATDALYILQAVVGVRKLG